MADTLEENSKGHAQQQPTPAYSVIHITGYTKIWPPNAGVSGGNGTDHHHHHQQQQLNYQQQQGHLDEHGQPLHGTTNFHLIAIARIQMTSAPTDLVNSSKFEFVTRHDSSGNVTFADQR